MRRAPAPRGQGHHTRCHRVLPVLPVQEAYASSVPSLGPTCCPAAMVGGSTPCTAGDARGGSCTSPLRIILSVQESSKMPSFHHPLRGHCHGTNPLFLPARARCTGVVLPHALLAVAQRLCCPSPAE